MAGHYKNEAKAAAAGKAVIGKISFGEWKVQTWENLGWHCCINWGNLSVSVFPDGQLMLLIGHNGTGIYNIPVIHGKDLQKVLIEAVPKALESLKYYTEVNNFLTSKVLPKLKK